MKRNYIYLNDSNFLEEINSNRQQTQYVKITLLDWEENPIEEIQGLTTGGSINLNGDSAVRRTCRFKFKVTPLVLCEVPHAVTTKVPWGCHIIS